MRVALACLLTILPAIAGCAAPVADSGPTSSPAVLFEAIAFETTVGPMTILLYPEAAPETVERMKAYVREGYYVGREFGRAVPGHVIQITDRAQGATEDTRTVPLEPHPEHHFSAGAAGIARGEDPNSGGSEFFVMDFGTSHLDGNYTVWGQVVHGLGTVRKAARVPALDVRSTAVTNTLPPFLPTPAGGVPLEPVPVEPAKITAADLVEVRLAGDVAARYPLMVAKNVREGDFRHSLEWPRDLRAGAPSDLTWFMRPYNGSRVPSELDVQIRLDDTLLPARGDPLAAGVYTVRWTPRVQGDRDATIVVAGKDVATLVVRVPG